MNTRRNRIRKDEPIEEEPPKVHVDWNGTRWVDPEEMFRGRRVKRALKILERMWEREQAAAGHAKKRPD